MNKKQTYLIVLLILVSLSMVSCSTQRTLIIPSNNINSYDITNNVKLTTTTVTNNITETEVFNAFIPANTITEGKISKVLSYGVVSTASAVDSVTIRFKVNGVTKQTFTMTPKVVTNADFHLDGIATQRTTGTTGSRASHQDICISDECNSNSGVGVFNTAIDNNLTITVQWNNAKAGNSFSLYQGFMEFKNGVTV